MNAVQLNRLMEYLKTHGEVTRATAMSECSIANLTACISKLRDRGVKIITDKRTGRNQFGEPISYAVYRLGGGE